MSLRLADGLALPADAATQTFLVVGKRGSGKSSTATRLAEQLIRAHVPVAVLDPVDVWWGIKAGADGTSEGGLPVYVFGGRHADLPLEPGAGSLMADVLVDDRLNAVMVLREFSNLDKARFVANFAERLYRRNQDPLFLIAEEAHELMPQQPFRGEEEMLGRMTRLFKLGRTSGIGAGAITQRVASLNKNATTQAEVLIAHRTTGPQDVKAIDGWIEHHHQQALRQQVLSTLAELKTGEAWIWAPDFPEDKPIGLRRTIMLLPETFDSRRTPKVGERRREPKQLADVDLDRLRSKMAATIERAKAADPRALQQTIAQLRRQVAELERRPAAAPKIVERPALTAAHRALLDEAASRFERASAGLADAAKALQDYAHQVVAELRMVRGTLAPTIPAFSIGSAPMVSARPSRRGPTSDAAGDVTPYQRDILQALARFENLGIPQVNRRHVAAVAGKSPKSSAYDGALRGLRDAGRIAYSGTGDLILTADGRALTIPEDRPVDLLAAYKSAVLSAYQGALLDVLAAAAPDWLTRDELSERSGRSAKSSEFDAALRDMRDLGIVEYGPGRTVRVAESVVPLRAPP